MGNHCKAGHLKLNKEVMGMSLHTIEREWRKAKAWLRRAISKV
jgi:hypothetical protein